MTLDLGCSLNPQETLLLANFLSRIFAWPRALLWYFFAMSLTDLPQVQSLSVHEKLELMDDLWKSVSSDLDAMEAAQEEKELLDGRWSRFLLNPASALTVEQFNQELNALRA
jgi:putative addiction module component (TIGR02574 family)